MSVTRVTQNGELAPTIRWPASAQDPDNIFLFLRGGKEQPGS